MPILKDQIKENQISHADFSSYALGEKLASEIAEVLRANTSVKTIDFQCSNLKDNAFLLIAKAIKDRNIQLEELNLDLTKLSSKMSSDSLKELMQLNLVKKVMVFGIKNIFTDTSIQSDLKAIAKDHNVQISFAHPDDRPQIGFFEKSKEELKERPSNGDSLIEVKSDSNINKRNTF